MKSITNHVGIKKFLQELRRLKRRDKYGAKQVSKCDKNKIKG